MAWKYRWWLVAALAVLELVLPPAVVWSKRSVDPPPPLERPVWPARADFGDESVSAAAKRVADWVASSRDNGNVGFVLIDKKQAHVYVFDHEARLRASSPVLLGGAKGDDTAPGVGSRPLSEVKAEDRTTPAGRFVAERGTNLRGEDVVWVSYDDAVSMHRVLTTHPEERRLERLATPTPDDNRISAGCINVPVAFFEEYVAPLFANYRAMVYILPEVKSLDQVFGTLLASR